MCRECSLAGTCNEGSLHEDEIYAREINTSRDMTANDSAETGAQGYRAVHAAFSVGSSAMPVNKEQWSRPKSVPFPKIWRKCSGLKRMENGKVPEFTIQDIPEDMHEDIVDFMRTHFCRDEVTCMSLGILQDPVSVLELQDVWRDALKQNMALVALIESEEDGNQPRIAGCNITCVTTKDDKMTFEKFQGQCIRTILQYALDKPSEIANVFERYDVNEYMTALGLCVDPVFRGQGLGLEILKARFDLCKAVDLQVTMTVFTGIASQLLAHRVGMEVIAEVLYEDCKEDGKPVFPNIKCKSVKAMAKRVEEYYSS